MPDWKFVQIFSCDVEISNIVIDQEPYFFIVYIWSFYIHIIPLCLFILLLYAWKKKHIYIV